MAVLALYTTIYPGVERYLADWYRSVLGQTDQEFDLWIGVDALEIETVVEAIGTDVDATWVRAAPGDTIAQVRERPLEQICAQYDAVVLVDSDDLLLPDRVAGARDTLRRSDLAGCALRLVDQTGADLGLTFALAPGTAPDQVFPRRNIFGLSNSAYSCDLLRRCLPIAPAAQLVDWFLSTRAWLLGARMGFGAHIEMEYRQHPANMVRVAPPFDEDQVARDTLRVREHVRLVEASPLAAALRSRAAALREWAAEVESFYQQVMLERPALKRYVEALNAEEVPPLWWSSVAHQSLRHMWVFPS